jgi:hypothetical protein
MPGWSDKLLDEHISAAVHHGTAVTARQKQAAWDRLREQVSRQEMRPAAVLAAPPRSRWSLFIAAVGRSLSQAAALYWQDTDYDRALRLRYACLGTNRIAGPMFSLRGYLAV